MTVDPASRYLIRFQLDPPRGQLIRSIVQARISLITALSTRTDISRTYSISTQKKKDAEISLYHPRLCRLKKPRIRSSTEPAQIHTSSRIPSTS